MNMTRFTTREYQLIKELVEQGICLESINEMYKAAKQEKEVKERETAISKARDALIKATEDYIKAIAPESVVSKENIENDLLVMEKKIKAETEKMDLNKKNTNFLNGYVKKMGW